MTHEGKTGVVSEQSTIDFADLLLEKRAELATLMSTLCLAMYRQVTRRGIAEVWEIYTIPISLKGGRSRSSIFLALMRVLKGRMVKYPMGRHRLIQNRRII